MSVSLQSAKDYLRVDADDDDALIDGFILAAKSYMANAGVNNSIQGDLYDVVVYMLVALFYANRDASEKDVQVPRVVQNFITQLSIKSLEEA
jgi:uncharacterized phage protein (predicted DNA packaging)